MHHRDDFAEFIDDVCTRVLEYEQAGVHPTKLFVDTERYLQLQEARRFESNNGFPLALLGLKVESLPASDEYVDNKPIIGFAGECDDG